MIAITAQLSCDEGGDDNAVAMLETRVEELESERLDADEANIAAAVSVGMGNRVRHREGLPEDTSTQLAAMQSSLQEHAFSLESMRVRNKYLQEQLLATELERDRLRAELGG